jgi:hypothetical protein
MPRQPVLILGFLAALALALAPAARSQTPKHAEPAHAATAPAQAEGGHAEPGHAGAEANPDILEPQPSLAIWTAVVFLVLLLVLYKFAWGPLSRALHQREEHMEHVLLDAEQAMYPWYEAAPRVFESLSAVDDQQLGGVIMWVPGMLVFWIALTIVFFRWSGREEREERQSRAVLQAGG